MGSEEIVRLMNDECLNHKKCTCILTIVWAVLGCMEGDGIMISSDSELVGDVDGDGTGLHVGCSSS